jgi:hypothetical protein
MKRFRMLGLAAAGLGLATLACSIDLPSLPFGPQIEVGEPGQFKIGPEQTETLEIPATGSPASLRLQFAVGELLLKGGGDQLLTGTATYNVTELKPVIEGSAGDWTVRTGDVQGFSAVAAAQLVNTWELTLGSDPLDLDFDVGAAKTDINLSDMSITRFNMDAGASEVKITFSTPNAVSLESFTVKAGAGQITLSQLANANTGHMDFSLGGGDASLDFSGELKQDLGVNISGAAGNFTITVPEGAAASLTTSGGFIAVNTGDGWISEGDGYTHAGSGPNIEIQITAGAGNVNLRSN